MGRNILIIDADRSARSTYDRVLKRRGYKVTVVSNGVQGVEKAIGGEFDIIILDLMLKDVRPRDALRQIRDNDRDILIIVTFRPPLRSLMFTGMDIYEYLSKPVNSEELNKRIQRAEERIELVREKERLVARLREVDKKLKDTAKRLKFRTDELEKLNRITIGRELKIVELKREIEELKVRIGER